MRSRKSKHKRREAGLCILSAITVFGVFAFCVWVAESGRNKKDELVTNDLTWYTVADSNKETTHENDIEDPEETVSERIDRTDILALSCITSIDEDDEILHEEDDPEECETECENSSKYVFYVIENELGERCELNQDLQRYIQDVLEGFGILEYWPLFYCQIFQESRFNAKAVSAHGDYGYCQLKGKYHEYFVSAAGLPEGTDLINDALSNLYVGAWIMSENIKHCGTTDKAISRYYTGNDKYYPEYVQAVRQWESHLIEVNEYER